MTSLPKGKIVVPVWSDDDEIKALVNDEGNIPVVVESYTPAPDSRIHGWDGDTWRKLPLMWGYYDRWAESLSDTKAADGTFSKGSAAVPEGYVYVVQGVTTRNLTGSRGAEYISVYDGTNDYILIYNTTAVRYVPTFLIVELVLKKDDRIKIWQLSCLHLDEIEGGVWGYKMKIAE